jgi:hypothetical protein
MLGRSEVYRVPGGHTGMFDKANVEILANALKGCLLDAQEREKTILRG